MTATLAQSVDVRASQMTDTPLFRRARTWWLILALLLIAGQNSLFTKAVTQSKELVNLRQTYDTSSPVLRALTLLLYVIFVGVLMGHWRSTLRALLRQRTFLLFLLLAAGSVLWSQDPVTTLKQLPRLLVMIFLGWFIGIYYTAQEQIRITLVTGLIVVVSSAFLAVALPGYGLDTGGEWKGIMGTKNQLGHAILFLFSGLLFRTDRRHRIFWTCAGLLALVVFVMTRSAESLMLGILMVAIRLYGPLIKRTRREKLPFILFTIASGMLAVIVGRVAVLDLFGKDTTLTGRTVEWAAIMPFAMQHFWLGYGYRAFWTGYGDSLQVMKIVGGSMHGADSGYIDLLLQFGIVGMILAVTIMLGAALKFVRFFAAGPIPLLAYWYFGLVCISFIGNFADAYFPLTGGAPEIVLIMACAGLQEPSSVGPRLHRKNNRSLPVSDTAT